MSVSSRPEWTTEGVPGQPAKLHRETLSQKLVKEDDNNKPPENVWCTWWCTSFQSNSILSRNYFQCKGDLGIMHKQAILNYSL